jgi:hypothetical protein
MRFPLSNHQVIASIVDGSHLSLFHLAGICQRQTTFTVLRIALFAGAVLMGGSGVRGHKGNESASDAHGGKQLTSSGKLRYLQTSCGKHG